VAGVDDAARSGLRRGINRDAVLLQGFIPEFVDRDDKDL
jgi:hypothetical protein